MWHLSCLAPRDPLQRAVLSFVAAQTFLLRQNLSANGVVLDSCLNTETRCAPSLRRRCQPHIMNFKKDSCKSSSFKSVLYKVVESVYSMKEYGHKLK